jgi:hypothetical protein
MYCDFSTKSPGITPDPRFLYLNARYREALAALNCGIAERRLHHPHRRAGTGETTLLNKL